MSLDDDLERVDALPKPRRPGLSLAEQLRTIRGAHRVAMGCEPERRAGAFGCEIFGLLPADPATDTLDGWHRLGAHEGARRAWAARDNTELAALGMMQPPRDSPSLSHAQCSMGGFGFSVLVLTGLRNGQ